MSVLVGQLFGPDHRFHQFAETRHWTGEVHLDRTQPKVPLLREHDRDLRPVGQLLHLEDGRDGVWCVFEITDPRFRAVDERKYLSAGFSGDFATSAVGAHVRYDNVMLKEISLVAKPGVWSLTPAQIDAGDPLHSRGGHSWGLSESHKRVLDRAHGYLSAHRAQRGADFVRSFDPAEKIVTTRKPTTEQIVASVARRRAEDAEMLVPAELARRGPTHRRTWQDGRLVAW